jgi:hypothetical protein
VLSDVLASVRRALKERGFSTKGQTFHQQLEHGNTILLSLQKSSTSTRIESEVAINYGVYSAVIGRSLQDEPGAALDVTRTHWRKRLGENGREKWLRLKLGDPPDERAQLIVKGIEQVLPDLLNHSTNEALRDEWLSGSSPGIGDMQRLIYAAILVHQIGPADRLRAVILELRKLVAGSVHESLVERQLARAGVQVP